MARESSSSSDEDEEHNAALRSVAIDSDAVIQFAMPSVQGSGRKSRLKRFSGKRSAEALEDEGHDHDDADGDGSGGLKLYQTRVQDLLQKHLDKVFEENLEDTAVGSTKSGDRCAEDETYDDEIRLYGDAPLGVSLKRSRSSKHVQVRLLPPRYDSSDDDSAERESRFQAAAVEGSAVISHAEEAQTKAFVRFLEAEGAYRRTDEEEAQRVGQLRRERGEEWLPSVAKEMMNELRHETQRRKAMSSEGKVGVVAKYRI